MQPSHSDAARIVNPNNLEAFQPQTTSVGIDPDNPPWGVWMAILVLVVNIGLQIAMSLLLLIPYAASRGGIDPATPDFGQRMIEFASTDKTAIFLQVFSLLPAHLLTLALIWCIVTGFGKRPFFQSIGLRRVSIPLWASAALGIALFIIGTAVAKLVGGDTTNQLEFIINSSIPTRYLIAFLAVATAPVVEELIYRGILYSALRRAVGVSGAVTLVLALFTIIHVPQYQPNYGVIMAVGILSVALTFIRAYTKSLLPCVVIHAVFNAVQAILLIFTAPAK